MSSVSIAVVMGGQSREYDVSLKTGQTVIEEFKKNSYKIHEVRISFTGEWSINKEAPLPSANAIKKLKTLGVDIVFLAVHGSFGEDGTVQALLERMGVKFTGSDASSSILAMDKVISGDVFTANNILVPKAVAFTRYELIKEDNLGKRIEELNYPLIVKPANQGSSLGVTLVEQKDDLSTAIEFALEHDNKIMVQQYIQGREVSCGVLENPKTGELAALPPTELKPVGADFFDYYAKYTKNATDEITPPDMPEAIIKRIQSTAIKAHELLGCSGYSRTDMIISNDEIFVIETNTLPGMTSTSILPQQAAAANISFSDLLIGIVTCALTKEV